MQLILVVSIASVWCSKFGPNFNFGGSKTRPEFRFRANFEWNSSNPKYKTLKLQFGQILDDFGPKTQKRQFKNVQFWSNFERCQTKYLSNKIGWILKLVKPKILKLFFENVQFWWTVNEIDWICKWKLQSPTNLNETSETKNPKVTIWKCPIWMSNLNAQFWLIANEIDWIWKWKLQSPTNLKETSETKNPNVAMRCNVDIQFQIGVSDQFGVESIERLSLEKCPIASRNFECISDAFRMHFGCISDAFRMHFGCISDKTCQKEMKGENWMELAVVWERCCQIY